MWTRTTAQDFVLGSYFGLVCSSVSVWPRFGKRLLLEVLRQREDSVIKLPSPEKVEQYKQSISQQYPSLENVALFGDGLKILLQRAGDDIVQNRFYNGWTHDHYVSNVFVFAPDGTIVMAVLNCPGSMHDSELATLGEPSMYDKIDQLYEETGCQCVMDSAFAARRRPSIIKSFARDNIAFQANTPEELQVLKDAKSVRQAAKWGMRALQGSFPRLRSRWKWEEADERLVGISLIVYLSNHRANNIDVNQIRTVYWNQLQQDPVQYFGG
jgi:hypothetical protein